MVKRNRIKEGIASNFLKSGSKKAQARVVLTQAYLNAQKYPSEMWFMEYLHEKDLYGFEQNLPCGIYFVDFVFRDKSIAIEVDGKSHFNQEQRYKDKIKDAFLKKHKLKVYRVDAYDNKRAMEVINLILNAPSSLWAGTSRPRKVITKSEDVKGISSWLDTLSKKKKRMFRKLAKIHGEQTAKEKIETLISATPIGSKAKGAERTPAENESKRSAVAKEDNRVTPDWLLDLYVDWEKNNARKERRAAKKGKKAKQPKAPRIEPVIIYKKKPT